MIIVEIYEAGAVCWKNIILKVEVIQPLVVYVINNSKMYKDRLVCWKTKLELMPNAMYLYSLNIGCRQVC